MRAARHRASFLISTLFTAHINPAKRNKPGPCLDVFPLLLPLPAERTADLAAHAGQCGRPARTCAVGIADTECVLGNDYALDLAGAFVDVEYFGIAEITLYRILVGIAVAAEDLHGVVTGAVSSFAAE